MSSKSAPTERSSTWIWIVYGVLFAASIPWYLPDGPLRTWFGLPHWVVASLCATTGIALFTLVVVRRVWPDDDR
jgi:uncharacterized membrane protein YraQ (UPF0718 family)